MNMGAIKFETRTFVDLKDFSLYRLGSGVGHGRQSVCDFNRERESHAKVVPAVCES